jgi:hypothetical protein
VQLPFHDICFGNSFDKSKRKPKAKSRIFCRRLSTNFFLAANPHDIFKPFQITTRKKDRLEFKALQRAVD